MYTLELIVPHIEGTLLSTLYGSPLSPYGEGRYTGVQRGVGDTVFYFGGSLARTLCFPKRGMD